MYNYSAGFSFNCSSVINVLSARSNFWLASKLYGDL